MELENQGGFEKNLFNDDPEKRGPESKRPDDINFKLKIQQARDFMIAKALSEGLGKDEIMRIHSLADNEIAAMIDQLKEK
ncbi:MAG: hypothetical protein A3B89_00760 [Candidatus Buchananbacteria bacterium RIFCSPHIGHO2_02_FULL_40_13]|uniref:Uncharacterized protein n=1 Tax=Candidatus Buchananbacteria bacterium RIFCSPLOWO2_01_FULL_39_33 TaxID=1797543 RepID=A0A1G1YH21_9BACT|nr:MAG: hypothetical protein A2820_00825 [Candidatus Buchananbacteria bacterium RIFCSPHIGHO2_01_FULL_40_35]OGY50404.1 MAG: hypothetical protein A3B89_00760 [Candidatus Buchananbacteria bacterium RIFCSPHIGHO2_02_FULL_40_13]OGY51544.1 MAG: hypothetical protein A3A02_01915 [Candidatus Buchananbacteria bacterium RIFCSPLOWO2_01_FULL_39_33]